MDLGSHWGPFGDPLGAQLADFWDVFTGSDFRSIFGLFLGGAGGRGGVPETSESEQSAVFSESLFEHARLPLRGAANSKASPLPPAPLVIS